MAQSPFSLLLLTPFILLLSQTNAQSATAPAPAGPPDIFAILTKAGGYSTFIHFLNVTQAGNQINNQVNNSGNQGLTVLAPSDNAFQNLPPGSLNNLSTQQQVQLIQFHILPAYYTMDNLATASNPVNTQASSQDGKVYGLYFSGEPNQNQVNVSSGIVQTTINNAVRQQFPLAVYQLNAVLWPEAFNETKTASPAPSPPAASKTPAGGSSVGATASAGPSPVTNDAKSWTTGLGLVSGLWLVCMGMLF